jgi:hypothetical protein
MIFRSWNMLKLDELDLNLYTLELEHQGLGNIILDPLVFWAFTGKWCLKKGFSRTWSILGLGAARYRARLLA